jgi:hypothetical protein
MIARERPDRESGDENEEDAMIQHAVSKGGTIYSESEQMKLTGLLIKRVRELTEMIDKQGRATNDLTERIRKLNVWLLVVTIAIGALTFAQVAVALRWIGR